ncbi:MAG: sensor histidine kinase KdpD [Syntrophorhabdus sp.]|nr:sensor histidine kinase KdpD [Syntrophorhabdus sp.]
MKQTSNSEDITRPDPDALLKEIEREQAKKGKLKIFLGYAPGVGKTYTMLQEAHVLKKRGEDIVVGIVETHKRAETQVLLENLEIIPAQRVEYKNIVLEELNLDTILARRPSIVLVDELAHANSPDSRHPKRYQDVEELLNSGIDVYTTVNIQHFESQVDVVAKITGIRMQETVPDSLLDRADEVQIIDIPLEELFQRLKEGKVYIPEQAKQAMQNFFQRGNLIALRELTLTLVARKMDTELLNYMKARAISGPWPAGERVMVCIAANPYAQQLLRRAYKIAKDTHAEWYAVYVSTPALKDLSDIEKSYLTGALNLAEELGARVITLLGTDIANEILRFAQENNITRIVIGKPRQSWAAGLWKGSPVNRLIHARTDFELHLVTPSIDKKEDRGKTASERFTFYPKDYAITLGMIAAITVLNLFLEKFIHHRSLVFIYLIGTIASALFFGAIPSVFASIISLLTFDFFFTEPRYSFSMYHLHDIVSIAVFFFTSIVVGQLVKTTKQQNLLLHLRLKRATLIEEMSREFLTLPPVEQLVGGFLQDSREWSGVLPLLRTTVLDEVGHIILKYIIKIIDAPSFVLFKGKDGRLQIWARNNPEIDLDIHEMAVAEWVYANGETAGAGTKTLSNVKVFFMPMKAFEETVGVIGIQYEFRNLLLDQRRLLSTISNLSSLSVARWVTASS